MKDTFKEKQIDSEILKRKRGTLKKERFFTVVKPRLKYLTYLFFLALLVYVFFYSPLFFIKKIETNSLDYINEEELVQKLEFLKDENFFLVDLSSSREDIIKEYAFVGNIYTEKVFPNRVVIQVKEKDPFIVVENEDGCFLLDSVGFVLLEGECGYIKTNYSVKEVVGDDLNNIEFTVNSQSNFYNAEKIFEVVNVLDYYGYSVKDIEVENQVGEFKLHDDRLFLFSLANDLEAQLKRFIIVKKKTDYDNIEFESLDMRYNRPVLKEL